MFSLVQQTVEDGQVAAKDVADASRAAIEQATDQAA